MHRCCSCSWLRNKSCPHADHRVVGAAPPPPTALTGCGRRRRCARRASREHAPARHPQPPPPARPLCHSSVPQGRGVCVPCGFLKSPWPRCLHRWRRVCLGAQSQPRSAAAAALARALRVGAAWLAGSSGACAWLRSRLHNHPPASRRQPHRKVGQEVGRGGGEAVASPLSLRTRWGRLNSPRRLPPPPLDYGGGRGGGRGGPSRRRGGRWPACGLAATTHRPPAGKPGALRRDGAAGVCPTSSHRVGGDQRGVVAVLTPTRLALISRVLAQPGFGVGGLRGGGGSGAGRGEEGGGGGAGGSGGTQLGRVHVWQRWVRRRWTGGAAGLLRALKKCYHRPAGGRGGGPTAN
jgi:hypothetical protein